jgi:hypothetical protein
MALWGHILGGWALDFGLFGPVCVKWAGVWVWDFGFGSSGMRTFACYRPDF